MVKHRKKEPYFVRKKQEKTNKLAKRFIIKCFHVEKVEVIHTDIVISSIESL